MSRDTECISQEATTKIIRELRSRSYGATPPTPVAREIAGILRKYG